MSQIAETRSLMYLDKVSAEAHDCYMTTSLTPANPAHVHDGICSDCTAFTSVRWFYATEGKIELCRACVSDRVEDARR